ncbi:MAG: class I SAM-dependent methyltransferase [Methylacidiphilaceae bacterium]|nr:class I SAM-dependent methyltransferase [Candidatus Methylacidiphilaceae bacterium]
MARIRFAISCLEKQLGGQARSCPFCGSRETVFLERKHLLLELRRCPKCDLQFRWPKDTLSDNDGFYQNMYEEGAVTALPASETIALLRKTNFGGSPMDFSDRITILESLLPSGKVLDYGSSWGYAVYQLIRAGYDAIGWELSRPRAEFGRKMLEVPVEADWSAIERRAPFDGILSSHVLEHLPSPRLAFDAFFRLLGPGGWVLILVPNGGGKNARELGVRWGPTIGEKHCSALTASFFAKNLVTFGFEPPRFASRFGREAVSMLPWDDDLRKLEGDELLIAARRR